MRSVLFRRNYRAFSGGHLKVWDYFQHVAHCPGFVPEIYFDPASLWDHTNLWLNESTRIRANWAPADADVLFLAGMDWEALPVAERRSFPKPVINLVQHVRHADPAQ